MDKHIKYTNKTSREMMNDFSLGSDMCSWMLSNVQSFQRLEGQRHTGQEILRIGKGLNSRDLRIIRLG